jgi:phage shock protein E
VKKLILSLLALFSTASMAATTPKDAYSMVKSGRAVIVDVREADEIKDGMIEKATWLPMSKINANEDWLKEFKQTTKDKKIFLYCRSGNRSGKVQTLLKAKGIESENIGGYEALKTDLPSVKAK